MRYVGLRPEDVRDLLDCEPHLVIRVVEVRAEANAGVRPEVTEDPARLEFRMDGGELRNVERDRSAAARGVTRAANLEAGLVGEVDEQLCLSQRVLANPRDADLLDEVVSRSGCIVGGDVRRS